MLCVVCIVLVLIILQKQQQYLHQQNTGLSRFVCSFFLVFSNCYCHNRNTLQVTSHLHLHATTSNYCVYGRLSLCWFYYYYFYTWYTGLLALVCVFVCVQHLQILVLLKYSILFYTSIIKFASFCLVILRIDYSCTYNLQVMFRSKQGWHSSKVYLKCRDIKCCVLFVCIVVGERGLKG